MSSIFHPQQKYSWADVSGYLLSAASFAIIFCILTEGWLW
jgi:hypothetical protein